MPRARIRLRSIRLATTSTTTKPHLQQTLLETKVIHNAPSRRIHLRLRQFLELTEVIGVEQRTRNQILLLLSRPVHLVYEIVLYIRTIIALLLPVLVLLASIHGYDIWLAWPPTSLQQLRQARAINGLLAYQDLCSHGAAVYSDLKAGEFRVIVLEPGVHDDSVRCRLLVCHPSDSLPYEALSYAWGDVTEVKTIWCNGQPLRIASNLYEALHDLRDPYSPRLLWIDALCINQDNLKERGHQVKHMQQIFSNASRVVVWLGAKIHDPMAILEPFQPATTGLFVVLLDFITGNWRDELSRDSYKIFEQSPSWDYVGFSLIPPRLTEYCPDIKDLEELLERPWFTRLWVIQEVAHARRVTIMCGKASINWELLASLVNDSFLAGLVEKNLSKKAVTGAQSMIEIERARRRVLSGGKQDILRVLLATNGAKCSDLRDKVYGILSLTDINSHETDAEGLEPDYSVDHAEVFKRVARWCINRGNLDILSCTTRKKTNGRAELESLPTWVPDWTCIDNTLPFVRYSQKLPVSYLEELKLMDSSHEAEAVPKPFITDRDELILYGKKVDVVHAISHPSCFKRAIHLGGLVDMKALKENKKWISECANIMTIRASSGIDIHDVVGTTATAGMAPSGAPASFTSAFAEYRGWLDVMDVTPGQDLHSPGSDRLFGELEAAILTWSAHRCFAVTERGTTALVPKGTRKGDEIVLFPHGKVPYVLRPGQGKDQYSVIGEAFVLNLLDTKRALIQEYRNHTASLLHPLTFMRWIAGERYVLV